MWLRVSITLLSLLLFACNPAPVDDQKNSQLVEQSDNNESIRLADFFEQSYQQDLQRSPMTQSYRGIKWDYDKWDDVSESKKDQDIQLANKRLTAINAFDLDQLKDNEKLSLKLYKVDVERRLANDQFRHHSYIMHQFRAWHTTVPSFLINIHKITNEEDALAYIARLNAVSPLFDDVIEQLKIRQEKAIYPPVWAYEQMVQASTNVISGQPFTSGTSDSSIWQDFQNKLATLELEQTQANELLAEARQALLTSVAPAYQRLIQALRTQQLLSPEGDGVWRLPNGDMWYQNRLNWFTTTALSAEQVHQVGLDNVARIHQLMEGIMQEVKFQGDLHEFFTFMRTDPQFYYANNDTGRQEYLHDAKALIDTMESKIPDYFGLTPKARIIIKRVEEFREKSAGKAFYQSPALDGSRPGIYYANLYDMQSMPSYQMEALAYHEGIPGHHMQRSISQELEVVPQFQKYLSFTSYTEGWGLYSEELAKDMGFYQDPYSDFGRLAMELWRACRLVVDTGIHSKKWSREQAIEYLTDNTPNSQNDSVNAIERYIAMPGQATAYMIGKLKILELRVWAKQQLGDKFELHKFHDEILKDGPVPLNILEEKIKNWAVLQKRI
ncbi:MAG: hypothetical protein ACI88A_003628 [Paraglaciecola sp.]|jgi:uncharacterized protein (DUF885 family)